MSALDSPFDRTLIEKAAPAMSANYFAHLFAPEASRDAVGAALAYEHELLTTSLGDSGAAASAKLTWWGEELQRLAGGEARHPLTQALSTTIEDSEGLARLMAEQLGAAMELARGQLPADDTELIHHLQHRHGAASVLLARAGGADSTSDAFARHLGVANGFVDVLAMQAAGHGGAVLASPEALPATGLAERADFCWSQAASATPADALPYLRSVAVLSALQRHSLQRLARQDYTGRVIETGMAGLSRLFTAWRAAGACERGKLPRSLR